MGNREVLGFKAGDGESYEIWFSFFSELKEQGLHGVDLVVSDQHKGLVKAILEQFEGASWQRCQTHFSQERSGQGAQEDTKRGQSLAEGSLQQPQS